LGKDSSFLKTDGVGTCVALHFHNKEKDIIGMAHIAFSDVLIQDAQATPNMFGCRENEKILAFKIFKLFVIGK